MTNLRSSIQEITHRLKYFMPGIRYEEKFRFSEVAPGKLYRSAEPTRRALAYLVEKYNLKSRVVLHGNRQRIGPPGQTCPGLIFFHLTIKPGSAPREDQTRRFLDFVANPRNQPALVNCSQGRDRTGCLCFVYRVERMGWDVDRAWREMRSFGFQSLPWHRSSQKNIVEWLEKRYGVKLLY